MSSKESFFKAGEYQSDTCTICLERYTEYEPAMVYSCGHAFHVQCAMQWRMRNNACPLCWERLDEAYLSTLEDAVVGNRLGSSNSLVSLEDTRTPLLPPDADPMETDDTDKPDSVHALTGNPRVTCCVHPFMRFLRRLLRPCS